MAVGIIDRLEMIEVDHDGRERHPDLCIVFDALGEVFFHGTAIEKAGEADVPIYEDSKLADTLSKLEIGEMIPPELYTVVAEILVFVDECDKIKGKVGK